MYTAGHYMLHIKYSFHAREKHRTNPYATCLSKGFGILDIKNFSTQMKTRLKKTSINSDSRAHASG